RGQKVMIPAGREGYPVSKDVVADELADDPLVLEDDLGHGGKIFVQERDQLGGGSAFGERGEIAHIGEEDGEFFLFSGEVDVIDLAQNIIHQLRRNVSIKRAASPA